jgi:hypothetical protein
MRQELISLSMIATIVIVLFTALQQETKASILGNLGQGYDAGKEQAKSDWNDGKSSDSSCPSGWTSWSWCTGYKAGYVKEWIALSESQ